MVLFRLNEHGLFNNATLVRVRTPRIFFFQAEDGIRDLYVTGVQTCALPIFVGLAVELGHHETLRCGPARDQDVVFSLPWYRNLQSVRHLRQGRWMPALLEFGRHAGERLLGRSEERRVGKECRSGWSP